MNKTFTNAVCVAALLLVLVSRYGGGGGILGGAPFSVDKLSVLIVEETGSDGRLKLPHEQVAIFTGSEWRNYVQSKGGQFRMVDQHARLSTDAEWVQQGVAAAQDKPLPWLMVSDGRRWTSEPLPLNETSLLDVLRRIGD